MVIEKTKPTMSKTNRRQQLASRRMWIAIGEMRVNPRAQRVLRSEWALTLSKDFDLEAMGLPVLSRRDGVYWIIDGQHRIEALKLIGLGNELVECRVYDDLSEAAEAELFLTLNNIKTVAPFDKFKAALTAGETWAVEINSSAEAAGFHIVGGGGVWNRIQAVESLRKIHALGGAQLVKSTLSILADSFDGDKAVSKAPLMYGMAMVLFRYESTMRLERLVTKLLTVRGGGNGILRAATNWNLKTERSMPECVAASVVDVYNKGGGRGQLESWWK